jgi:magnesium chelatase family protein
MPPMTMEEAIETTKIQKHLGVLLDDGNLSAAQALPCTASYDFRCRGEMSLAHNGVLLLDELSEFKRSTLEVLRQR